MRPERARETMVARQIAARGVSDAAVLAAMREVPRDAFVPNMSVREAYADTPLPIGQGQTISQPYMVSVMVEAAQIGPEARVLEIGSGCGYAAAVLSRIAREVFALERHAALAERSRETLARLGYDNAAVRAGDGLSGWPEQAPFDAIIVSAAAAGLPEALADQIAAGGRLVVPVEAGIEQRLLRLTRSAAGRLDRIDLGPVRFVPLVGS